jgi:hypothetical protein
MIHASRSPWDGTELTNVERSCVVREEISQHSFCSFGINTESKNCGLTAPKRISCIPAFAFVSCVRRRSQLRQHLVGLSRNTSLARLRTHSLRSTGGASGTEAFFARCPRRRRTSFTRIRWYVATRRAESSSDTTTRRTVRWYGPAGANVTSELPKARKWPPRRCGRDASAASLVVSAARARSGLEITTARTVPSCRRSSGARMALASSAIAWWGMSESRCRCPITGHPGGAGGSCCSGRRRPHVVRYKYTAETNSDSTETEHTRMNSMSANSFKAMLLLALCVCMAWRQPIFI